MLRKPDPEIGIRASTRNQDPADPRITDTRRRKGRKITSSFETELLAIRLATEAIMETDDPGNTVICTDSMSSISALASQTSKITDVMDTMDCLDRAAERCNIALQWVPAHVSLPGNEAADEAAKLAARGAGQTDNTMSYAAAVATINRHYKDEPPPKAETAAVYQPGFDKHALNLPRWDRVQLARLRVGHHRGLAAYRALVQPGFDPICPRCRQEPQTMQHWLTDCPAMVTTRLKYLGEPAPDLSVFQSQPRAVVELARVTLL